MIGRWYTSLVAFDLDITYVSGKSQQVADPLSRLFEQLEDGSYSGRSNPATTKSATPGPAVLLSAMAHVTEMLEPKWCGRRSALFAAPGKLHISDGGTEQPSIQSLQRLFSTNTYPRNLPRKVWSSHQQADPRLSKVYSFLSMDSTGSANEFSGTVRARAQSYQLINGVLYYRSIKEVGTYALNEGWLVAVPHSLIHRVIKECHGDNMHGHGGQLKTKTVLAVRQRYHFRGMRKAVRAYLGACVKCKRAKSQLASSSSPLVPFLSSAPFLCIPVDLYKPGTITAEGFKYVLTVVDLCTKWVSTVCRCLGIDHIKTTPYHPRTNGLCESQHKMLTVELKIRSARDHAPEWSTLLTEISFAANITRSTTADGLSPFNLVFGRAPRLSASDICFPVRRHPPQPLEGSTERAAYDKQLRKKLQGLQFRALEANRESKEVMRIRHDIDREGTIDTKGTQPRRIGDIVSVFKPQPKLTKLRFQWSLPLFVVTKVDVSTLTVRDLANKEGAGAKISVLNKVGRPEMLANRKMTSLYTRYPVPSFWARLWWRSSEDSGVKER